MQKLSSITCCRLVIIILGALTLTHCGNADSEQPSQSTVSASIWLDNSDEWIAQTVYFDKRTPDSFYQEQFSDSYFTTVTHLKNSQLNPMSTTPTMELCTDNYNEALNWSQANLNYDDDTENNVVSTETELYFQFSYAGTQQPLVMQLNRLFKCNSFDRATAGITNGKIIIGSINRPSFDSIFFGNLIEYLWLFSTHNNSGNAVLATAATQSETGFQYSLLEAKLTVAAASGCDVISVYESQYVVDRVTGEISMIEIPMQKIYALRVNQSIQIC